MKQEKDREKYNQKTLDAMKEAKKQLEIQSTLVTKQQKN